MVQSAKLERQSLHQRANARPQLSWHPRTKTVWRVTFSPHNSLFNDCNYFTINSQAMYFQ